MVLFVHIVKNQKNDFNFFFVQCMIKQLLDSVFAIPQKNRGLGSASLITLTLTLINLDITTEPHLNNCIITNPVVKPNYLVVCLGLTKPVQSFYYSS